MKDLFYLILFIWLIWRVLNAFSSAKTKSTNTASNPSPQNYKREGETTVDYIPPKKKGMNDKAGEYVDYEEVK
jgi:hypothetical protein